MDHYQFFPEWEDDERMRVLMGPMPATKNQVAFNSRTTFWTAAILNWCKAKETLTFTLYDGQMAFRRGTQVPMCFPEIFQHLLKSGDFITVEDLLKHENESWATWSKKLVITPSQWAWTAIQDTMGWKRLDSKVLIHRKVLEERADELLRVYWTRPQDTYTFDPEDVITVEELYSCTNTCIPLRLEDLNLVLHCLAKKRRIVIREHQGKSLLKVAKPGQTEPLVISETEVAEYELRKTTDILKQRIGSLQQEMEELQAGAKKAVISGLKIEAMSWLRRKRRAEKSIKAALLALENVSVCLHQLQDSKLNVNILNSFQLGANALKSSIAASGGTGEVHKEMDSLQEVLDDCKEITDALAFGVTSPESHEESDLEQELKELVIDGDSSYSTYTPASTEYEGLPSVPRTDPLKKYLAEEAE